MENKENQANGNFKQIEAIDGFLQAFIGMTEDTEYETSFDITLTVNGLIITGLCIGKKRFFELFGKDLAQGFRKTGREDLVDVTEEIFKGYDLPVDKEPHYIHLEDAYFFTGGELIPTGKGGLWRVKLSSVDGFALGRIK